MQDACIIAIDFLEVALKYVSYEKNTFKVNLGGLRERKMLVCESSSKSPPRKQTRTNMCIGDLVRQI